MLRVEDAGYPIVLHVHDEIVSEILKGFGSIEEYEALMMVRESWFKDWPIKAAGGWRGREFRK
jgi:DNA polymerase